MSKKSANRSNESDVPAEVSIIRIPPHHYIHVLDQNTNIARIEIGPLTYIRQDNERSEVLESSPGPAPGPALGHVTCPDPVPVLLVSSEFSSLRST